MQIKQDDWKREREREDELPERYPESTSNLISTQRKKVSWLFIAPFSSSLLTEWFL